MDSTTTTVKRTTLVLDEEETLYLRNLMQNFLGSREEPKRYKELRMSFWTALGGSIPRKNPLTPGFFVPGCWGTWEV